MAIKQVIVLRKDLNMRKGKMVAQGAHACLNACLDMLSGFWHERGEWRDEKIGNIYEEWQKTGTTKICVSVDSEQELLSVYENAKIHGIVCSLIQDAGHTEFAGVPTYTAVAVGPAESDVLDPITGKLKLL